MNRETAAQEIVRCCQKLYDNHFVAAYDGNVSVLVGDEALLITPTTQSKGDITEDMLITLDFEGRVTQGNLTPSSEAQMHIECYKKRNDIKAVVHAHPPYATALASTEHVDTISEKILLPEILITTGRLGVAPYCTPGSTELALHVAEVVASHNGVLMKNHGVVAVGPDIKKAYMRLESIELYCKVRLLSALVGTSNFLCNDEVEALLKK